MTRPNVLKNTINLPLNLVMFGPFNWDGTWYSRHHLTVGLGQRSQVTIVDDSEELRHLTRNPWHLFCRARITTDVYDLMRYKPPGWLPEVRRWPWVRKVLHRLRSRSLLSVLQSYSSLRAICYVWNPEYQEAVEPLARLPLVYHCYDKYDRYVDASQTVIGRQEAWLARRAALCIAASAKLGEYLDELGARNVHVLRHGVDTNIFRPGMSMPPRLAEIARPRIGIVARFNEVLDVETLRHIAMQRPDWSLVLVGAAAFSDAAKRSRFEEFCRLPNVYLVGARPPREIPHWLNGFDVGLICYDLQTWGPYNQPIKMYEYLACGLPVVSSDILSAREFGDLVACCPTHEDWVPTIERALTLRSPQAVAQRIAFARANSWNQRVAELEQVLTSLC